MTEKQGRIKEEMISASEKSENTAVYRIDDFDCRRIFTCGQCFRWKQSGDWWKGVARGRFLRLRSDRESGTVTVSGEGTGSFLQDWHEYFDLGTDYSEIRHYLAGLDGNLKAATEYGKGIRLLKQEPFETLISFIISANNNIPRISKCIDVLCTRYGEQIGTDPDNGEPVFAFPLPERLAGATPEEISDVCHAGYRSPYIVAASKKFIDLGGDLSDPEQYPGVGPKVAACIRLFTGSDMNAFPVDVWVRRLIQELYFGNEAGGVELPASEVRKFVTGHFPRYGGYAQQYLFYWRRESGHADK